MQFPSAIEISLAEAAAEIDGQILALKQARHLLHRVGRTNPVNEDAERTLHDAVDALATAGLRHTREVVRPLERLLQDQETKGSPPSPAAAGEWRSNRIPVFTTESRDLPRLFHLLEVGGRRSQRAGAHLLHKIINTVADMRPVRPHVVPVRLELIVDRSRCTPAPDVDLLAALVTGELVRHCVIADARQVKSVGYEEHLVGSDEPAALAVDLEPPQRPGKPRQTTGGTEAKPASEQ